MLEYRTKNRGYRRGCKHVAILDYSRRLRVINTMMQSEMKSESLSV
jgi:hypothetical protein